MNTYIYFGLRILIHTTTTTGSSIIMNCNDWAMLNENNKIKRIERKILQKLFKKYNKKRKIVNAIDPLN